MACIIASSTQESQSTVLLLRHVLDKVRVSCRPNELTVQLGKLFIPQNLIVLRGTSKAVQQHNTKSENCSVGTYIATWKVLHIHNWQWQTRRRISAFRVSANSGGWMFFTTFRRVFRVPYVTSLSAGQWKWSRPTSSSDRRRDNWAGLSVCCLPMDPQF